MKGSLGAGRDTGCICISWKLYKPMSFGNTAWLSRSTEWACEHIVCVCVCHSNAAAQNYSGHGLVIGSRHVLDADRGGRKYFRIVRCVSSRCAGTKPHCERKSRSLWVIRMDNEEFCKSQHVEWSGESGIAKSPQTKYTSTQRFNVGRLIIRNR